MRVTAHLPCIFLLPWLVHEAAGEAPDFNRDIRPILSENCFHCHGPDQKARKANLRLDTFKGATEGGEIADPIVPGNPEESEVVARILATDPDEVMPPPESKRTLTERQKELLKDWIASGANYDEHWAWLPPVRPRSPIVKGGAQKTNPIDAFLLRRLEKEGLSFSEPASPANLLRRLSLDLIGLPPSPEDLIRFSKAYGTPSRDPSGKVTAAGAEAYQAEVERLLASPRFGERWARPWLDLARYADSNGFQADQLRPSWAYRDWVIDALNANMPYDQFTIEQLAGDLLPEASISQRIATGFHRTVTCNVEAGVSPEGNRVNQVFDRVNTTATVWLGISMECAQCHDHKYDPFTMKDYYSLFAFFNNTPLEVQLPSSKTDVSHDFVGPYLDLPLPPEQQEQADELDRRTAALTRERAILHADSQTGFAAWEKTIVASLATHPQWQPLILTKFGTTGGEDHRLLENGSILLTGATPKTSTYTVELESTLKNITAFRLEALTHPDLPGQGPGRGDAARSNFVLHEFKAALRREGTSQPLPLRNASADFSQKNWNILGTLDGNAKTGWAISPQFGKPHWATFDLAQPLADLSGATLLFTLEQNFGQGRVIGNLRLSAISDPTGTGSLPKEITAILKKPSAKRNKKQRNKLKAHFLKSNPKLAKLETELARLQKERAELKSDQTLVMVELETPRRTHILKRGNFLAPDAEVQPRTPARFPKLEKASNRLHLARWLVQRDNPLTARVAVNRWWAELFGHGIVATLEDFGTQSEHPTHPELLDWLAVEFMESGWDMKRVLKTMVTSSAYQQSSRFTPEVLAKDPRNLLHARAPRFRMDAERLRDNSLAISGLLSPRMHGKPIMPYQPPGLWRQTGRNEPKWEEAKDENRWRRGIYIVYRRAAPYPSMVNFDAPDRGACTVRRPRTNTPSQALTLLNDPAYVEMALAFADRILTEADSPGARANHAFRLALARPATEKELSIVHDLIRNRLSHYHKNPQAAADLLKNPKFVYKPKHQNQIELASWFYLANALLNLDETVTRN
jgi:hypothetical protein